MTETTPFEPDPDRPEMKDFGPNQEDPIVEEYLEATEDAREQVLENDDENK